MSEPLAKMNNIHDQEIKQVKWSPHEKETLWVAAGNNLTMWNLYEQQAKFVHAGHMSSIWQMDLHPI